MLDIQRYRSSTLRKEVHLTRAVLWTHLALGVLVVLLLLLHEVFGWAAGAAAWYLASVLMVGGMISGFPVCRWLLGLVFFGFSIAGILFLSQVLPGMQLEKPPLLPHGLMPFWLGVVNITYITGGIFVLCSQSIRKAAEIGFKLW